MAAKRKKEREEISFVLGSKHMNTFSLLTTATAAV